VYNVLDGDGFQARPLGIAIWQQSKLFEAIPFSVPDRDGAGGSKVFLDGLSLFGKVDFLGFLECFYVSAFVVQTVVPVNDGSGNCPLFDFGDECQHHRLTFCGF